MRTLLLILIGLAVSGGLQYWLAAPRRGLAAAMFTVAWLGVVLWNLRTGLSHGYALGEEAPIQALIFVLPVALAWWLAWAWRTG